MKKDNRNKNKEDKKEPYTIKNFIIDFVQVVGSAVILTLILLIFIQPCIVSGDSMNPTYHTKDFLILWKLGKIERNDIIAFNSHNPREEDYIKRVIAVAGDHLVISDSIVTVNGEVIDEPYINEPVFKGNIDITVSENCIFVMGDNRNYSLDSRVLGEIKLDDVIGRVLVNFNALFR